MNLLNIDNSDFVSLEKISKYLNNNVYNLAAFMYQLNLINIHGEIISV